MSTLKMHVHELTNLVPLPAGVQIQVDSRTDNLIVHDHRRAFCITHTCLNQWPIERVAEDYKSALGDLLAGHEQSVKARVRFFDLEEIRHRLRRPLPTAFDEPVT